LKINLKYKVIQTEYSWIACPIEPISQLWGERLLDFTTGEGRSVDEAVADMQNKFLVLLAIGERYRNREIIWNKIED
jgi:hypothetical protein